MNSTAEDDVQLISPSPFVKRFGRQIVAAANAKPVLDIGCGGGRNAIFLARLGASVICVDKDLKQFESERVRLAESVYGGSFSRITTLRSDLLQEPWPFSPGSAGGIISVHFQ